VTRSGRRASARISRSTETDNVCRKDYR